MVFCLAMIVCILLACDSGETPDTNDGNQNNNETVVPHEHSFGDWKTVKEATCTEKGSKTRVCSQCDYTEHEEIPAGHNYVDNVCSACGDIKYSEGLKFISNGNGTGTYSVSGIGSCTDRVVYVPATTPEGYPVTGVYGFAFRNCTSLTKIVLPDSVTSIGSYAFSYCRNLTSVTIPEGVTSIEGYTFYECNNLTSITIPSKIERIGDNAFSNCYRLVEVINHSNLSFTCGSSSPGYIAYYAKEVHQGESKIDNQNGFLFYTYGGVNYLVDYLGDANRLVLPENYKGQSYEINKHAFRDCIDLMSVTISAGVTNIGQYAFTSCYKLIEVINHSELSMAPDQITNGNVAFSAKEVHTGESKIKNQDEYLFYTYNGVNYLIGYMGTATDLILPEKYNGQLYEIYQYAFARYEQLTSITIPNDVNTIGEAAFKGCSNLKSVTLPNGVTSIAANTFYDCFRLTSITMPDGITSIGNQAFCGCSSLTSVTIPKDVTNIYANAFLSCSKLTDIYFTGTEAEWNAISKSNASIPSSATVHFNYVPSES